MTRSWRSVLARLTVVVASGALFASCGGSGLSGSIGQFISLDYNRQEILRDENAFQITYYNDTPTQVDVVIRLTVVTTGFDFTPGHSFDLSGEYAPGHPRAVVTHAAGGEPSRGLPPVNKGTLTLSSGGTSGQRTQGKFTMSFQNSGGDFGQGTDVNGDFDSPTLDANAADGGS